MYDSSPQLYNSSLEAGQQLLLIEVETEFFSPPEKSSSFFFNPKAHLLEHNIYKSKANPQEQSKISAV